ncbi:MAG: S8 family serine peptidase, partial [Gemmatimonadaceae bacterium]|nr:S8 family serine peptidase [Gemmatimonadaceae bacterium]
GRIAPYSNYGPRIDIMAPGGNAVLPSYPAAGMILSTDWGPAGATYSRAEGTSMAAPHVAGVLALMASLQPTQSPQQLLQRLFSNATTMLEFQCGGRTASCGAGLLDALGAVASAHEPAVFSTIHVLAERCNDSACRTTDPNRSKIMTLSPGATSGPYSFTQLAAGVYDVWAFRDDNGNGLFDAGEPWGEYPTLIALSGSVRSNIDVVIPGVAASSAFSMRSRPRDVPSNGW